ncbi:MAG: hypothetical protein KBS83_05505 [Lachnospiraceae bacterium]|nr:hypothetical protein [Candidatus Equihabitans merdae]
MKETLNKLLQNKKALAGIGALVVIVVIVLAVGLGKNKAASSENAAEGSNDSTISADVNADSSNSSDSSDSENASEPEETPLAGDYFDENTPSADEGEAHASEGLNVPAGAAVSIPADAVSGKLGETYSITSGNHFTLTIDDISYTNARSFRDANKVLGVTLTYHSNDWDGFMLGQINFALLDQDGVAPPVYYFNADMGSQYNFSPVGPGSSHTVTLGFTADNVKDHVTLIYEDMYDSEYIYMTWNANV